MKTIFPAVLLLSALFMISACKDDKDSTPTIKGILKAETDTLTHAPMYYFPYTETELGYEFTPLTDGTITHLGTKTETAGQFRVRIYVNGWSASSIMNVIAEQVIAVTAADKLVYEPIDDLQVKKDTKYVITVHLPPNSYFKRMATTFPHQVGGISITRFAGAAYSTVNPTQYFIGEDSQANPAPYLEGIPDFVFVKK